MQKCSNHTKTCTNTDSHWLLCPVYHYRSWSVWKHHIQDRILWYLTLVIHGHLDSFYFFLDHLIITCEISKIFNTVFVSEYFVSTLYFNLSFVANHHYFLFYIASYSHFIMVYLNWSSTLLIRHQPHVLLVRNRPVWTLSHSGRQAIWFSVSGSDQVFVSVNILLLFWTLTTEEYQYP